MAPTGIVFRWVPTYVNQSGVRTLVYPMQGRYTYESKWRAEEVLRALQTNNSADRLREIWGADPQFEAREVECWPGHHDPKTCWFPR